MSERERCVRDAAYWAERARRDFAMSASAAGGGCWGDAIRHDHDGRLAGLEALHALLDWLEWVEE